MVTQTIIDTRIDTKYRSVSRYIYTTRYNVSAVSPPLRGLHCVPLLLSTRAQPRGLESRSLAFLLRALGARTKCMVLTSPSIEGDYVPPSLHHCVNAKPHVECKRVVRDNLKDPYLLPRPRSTQLSSSPYSVWGVTALGTLLSCARSRAGGISRNPLGNPTVPSRFTGDRSRSTSETVTKSNDSNFRFSAASFDGCSQRAVEQRSILSLPAFRLPPYHVPSLASFSPPAPPLRGAPSVPRPSGAFSFP